MTKHCTVCGKELYYRAKGTLCKQHQPGPAPYYGNRPVRAPRTPDESHAPRYGAKS